MRAAGLKVTPTLRETNQHIKVNMGGGSQNYGYHFGGPYNKDYSILGSILGFSGKLPHLPTSARALCVECWHISKTVHLELKRMYNHTPSSTWTVIRVVLPFALN